MEWEHEELKASVEAYLDLQRMADAGQRINKAQTYRDLSARFPNRTPKAFEYRMQNISYVLQETGQEWISGLKPAKNVGALTFEKIHKLISATKAPPQSATETQPKQSKRAKQANDIEEPKGRYIPARSSSMSTSYARDKDVRDWVLANAQGRCECCREAAPFVTDEGTPFLQVHHAEFLSEGGADTIENAIAICPAF